jgi:hypothetical protein
MGPLAIAALLFGAAVVANLAMDMSVNAAQNWYDDVYTSAFWSHRVTESPALDRLKREEADIDRLMREPDVGAE